MRKRIVMFMTTLALSTMMLAGCGNKDNTNNSVTSSVTQEPDEEATTGPVVNEDDSDYNESDMAGDDGVVGDVVDDAADAVDDVVDDTADVVDDATGDQGTDGQPNNAGQSAVDDDNAATAAPTKKPAKKNTTNKKNNNNKNNNNNKKTTNNKNSNNNKSR